MFISKSFIKYLLVLLIGWQLVSCQQNNQFSLLSGDTKRIEDYQGKWLLINFWAEWCPPCLKEIPELNALAEEGIQVLAVSYDKLTNTELEQLKSKYQINYPIIATFPMPYLPMESPTGLPANYLFTPSGQMIGPLLGTQTKESFLEIIRKVEKAQQSL